MSLPSRDPILLTPGPLTTSLETRSAMLRDWGSWDSNFNAVTAEVRKTLLEIVNGQASHVCVPLQGSGTFAIEAAVGTMVPREGHLLVLDNGAYCKRMARLAGLMGRRLTVHGYPDDAVVVPADVDRLLAADRSITHVGLIHCETSVGIWNPLPEVAEVVARHGRGLIVDAMSSFGALPIDAVRHPFDALIAASGKCIEGVPGMGFVIARRSVLERREGNSASLAMDLYDQWVYMEKTTQWRYTPPTHVVVAFNAALRQFLAEGGQPARFRRYSENCAVLVDGMSELGFRTYLDRRHQAPIIVTFHAPADPRYTFKELYARVRDKGFILYPGKLTQIETFRVGCIGAIGASEIRQAVHAVADALREMGIDAASPAAPRAAAA